MSAGPAIEQGNFFWYKEPHPMPNVPITIEAIAEVRRILQPSGPEDDGDGDGVTAENESLVQFRLYYKPEDTPKGRDPLHGEDEVLASWRNPRMPYSAFVDKIVKEKAVKVVTYREYCMQKALEARYRGTAEAEKVAPAVQTFFIREDFQDYSMQSRDALFRQDVVEDQIDI